MEPSARRPLADDTPLETEQVQIAMWRRMTPSDKMRLVSGCAAAFISLPRKR